MSDIPPDIRELARRRDEARRSRDFAAADSLRERIRASGFDVTDTPGGSVVAPAAGPELEAPAEGAVDVLDHPPSSDASVQWIVQGWPQDVARGIASFDRHHALGTLQHVVVDMTGSEPTAWPSHVDFLRVPAEVGWAGGRNAGLRRATGRIVVIADGSVEATGDALSPLIQALADPTVGMTGPFGIVTEDLREFHKATGSECDAVEGYLMAFRRELVEGGLQFDDKFRFYRTADIEFSFQVKAMGLRVTVTPVPVERHEHRMWTATPEDERARLSKRNFYRFLDRWRGRTDLLVGRRD